MLELREEQLGVLRNFEAGHFVTAVCHQYMAERPESAQSPGSDEIHRRMHAAHVYAGRVGFTSAPHIVRLMWLATDAPRIHDDPAVDAWLRKVGAAPEQRLDDLIALMDRKLKPEGGA